jgi:hypothetical protein
MQNSSFFKVVIGIAASLIAASAYAEDKTNSAGTAVPADAAVTSANANPANATPASANNGTTTTPAPEQPSTPQPQQEDGFTPKPPEFPEGCAAQGFAFKDKLLILKPKEQGGQTVYLFQNIQEYALVLNRFGNLSPGASAGFSSWLHKQNWSAFALNGGEFSLSCLVRAPHYVTFVSCQDVLKVCSFPAVFPASLPDGRAYWVAEDKDLATIMRALDQRGKTS